ncbi:MAG: Mpo1-like protein, partial [Bacteroidia bacterium]
MSEKEYKTFQEFYPYYLNEHSQVGTRITHFIGT